MASDKFVASFSSMLNFDNCTGIRLLKLQRH